MFDGRGGGSVGWTDVMAAVAWADVIILGEQHDDAVGHAVEQAVVEDTLARWPRSAVSLEMLERDEQPLVDDYFDGIIDAETFAKLTFSEKWAGEGSWKNWYQPMIDAAKISGGRVIAANAPRRYVRLARTEGYDRLRSLPRQRRRMFDLPRPLADDAYHQRFVEVMSGTESHDGEPAPNDEPTAADAQRIDGGFRSQLMWDATMADSIARAKRSGATKVVHVIGQFHCDFNGGTVQQLRSRLGGAKILVISMQRDEPAALREEDHGRADIVIYTGKRPPEPKPKSETAESQPESPSGAPDTQPDSAEEPESATTLPDGAPATQPAAEPDKK